MNFKEAADELSEDDGIYSLLLTGRQARAVMKALEQAPSHADTRAAQSRLKGLLGARARQAPGEAQGGDRSVANGDAQRLAPPYDLPDAEALSAFTRTPGDSARLRSGKDE
ncbi:hypothetical protein ACF06P_35495 [Streptomyces sp. NPDC015684]|uniref:hypothetical protein n=1 Tax=Streptomyces sp. NPDC015684 TaxID=3364963 RepID=UPI0036FE5BD1